VKAGNAEAIASLYSPDAISMPANSPPLKGHEAILKFNQDFLKLPQLTDRGPGDGRILG
jgi:ketosteroid isomerase-like protein